MHRPSLSPWWRALFLLVGAFAAASPLLINSYQATHAPKPPVWPIPEDPVAARKANLINTLLPAIQANNQALLADRERLLALQARAGKGKTLRQRDLDWLAQQAPRYRLEPPASNPPSNDWFSLMVRRVDIVPAALALAQGAMESAWGTSRFALEANNYFGHWCFKPGCGLVPAQRPDGARHEVARFDSPVHSVRRYMDNLNSHPRYQSLRMIRQRQRRSGQEPDAWQLAAGLDGYSAIGDAYIRAIRGLIRGNQLDRYPSL